MSYREFKSPIPVPDPVVRVDQPLSIGQLGVAFMALGAALTMALVVFFGELCVKSRVEKLRKDMNDVTKLVKVAQSKVLKL